MANYGFWVALLPKDHSFPGPLQHEGNPIQEAQLPADPDSEPLTRVTPFGATTPAVPAWLWLWMEELGERQGGWQPVNSCQLVTNVHTSEQCADLCVRPWRAGLCRRQWWRAQQIQVRWRPGQHLGRNPPDQCPGRGFTQGRESTGPGESHAPRCRPQLWSRKPCPLCFWLLGLCVCSRFFQKPFPDLPPGLPVAELPLFLRC